MSTIKTKIKSEKVIEFLHQNFDENITSIYFLKGGEQSQAFSFNSNSRDLVIRINNQTYSFEKDKYAYNHFNNPDLPIPEIFEMGKFDENYFYAISEFAEGKTLDTLDKDAKTKLLPQIISIHDAIHKIKIEDYKKFGDWDSEGDAKFDSWKGFIIGKKDNVYKNWEKLYKETFLERKVVEKVTEKIRQLTKYVPEERYLVHGDYGGNNMTSDGEKITGVLYWGESKYGDTLYDIAWMDFFDEDLSYKEIFYNHYKDEGFNIENFNERMICYKLHLGLGAIGFFALSGQKESYEWAKNKLLKLLE